MHKPIHLMAVLVSGVLLAVAQSGQAQFVSTPPLNQHQHIELVEGIYEQFIPILNATFELPKEVGLTSGACQQANAFYIPGEAQILLCVELIESLVANGQQRGGVVAIISQLYFFLFHEVGHALVDVLDLPVVGQEEDGVDQLAVLLLNDEPLMAMWAADYWNSNAGRVPSITVEAFADAHDLNEQRFFNIACWTYGSDPLTRGYVVKASGLPAQRAQRCQSEFDRLRSSWERLLIEHLKNPAAFASPSRNATGQWRFMESMSDSGDRARCSASGALTLWQLSDSLSGTMEQQGSCVYFGVPTDNDAPATPISTGQVTETAMSFNIANCRYQGSFDDESRMALSGSMVCTSDQPDGSILELTGTWHAVR